MPRGGTRIGPDGKPLQGRRPGSRNKATIEREAEAERAMAAAVAMENPGVQQAVATLTDPAAVAQAQAAGRKNGKSILEDFSNLFAGMAAYYQPAPPGYPKNTNENEPKFRQYAELAVYAAEKVAQYQSPKLSAVMVGQAQTRKIEVVGGLPAPGAPPALTDEQHRRAIEAAEPGAGPVIDGKAEAPELVPAAK